MLTDQPALRIQIPHLILLYLLRQREHSMRLSKVQRDNGKEFSARKCHQGFRVRPLGVHDEHVVRVGPTLHPAVYRSMKDVHDEITQHASCQKR